jgi:hypothetical protein
MPFIEGNIPENLLKIINMQKPKSHMAQDFMYEHWTKYVDECSSCHQRFSYGTKNNEFCANSGCHDIRWQNLSLRLKPVVARDKIK